MSLPFAFLLAAATLPGPDSTDHVLDDTDGTAFIDSIEATFHYQQGRVELPNGVATLQVPDGFKFLDQEQSATVIVDLWGNPDADGILGMVLPKGSGVLDDDMFAFVVQYDEIGYVKDDDANDVDYDEMAQEMRSGETESNAQRAQLGYEPIHFIGWAAAPYYDQERKVLHWAKELQFGDSAEANTLNYNVRVLGRKGVLVLNAVSDMRELPLVQQAIPGVLDMVQFNDGYRYDQFDSKVDDVAAWTIGGLVAGKVLAKAGILTLILKNIKLVLLAIAGIGAAALRIFRRKKKEDGPTDPAGPPATT